MKMKTKKTDEHNSKCDVVWIEGKPTYARAIQKNEIFSICLSCHQKISELFGVEPLSVFIKKRQTEK